MQPLDLATHYISHGLKVFPCRSRAEETVDQYTGEVATLGEKTPLLSNGFKGATRFQHIVKRWFTDWPDAAVGLPTGKDAGFFVLDIDAKPGGANGFEWLAEMEAEHGPLPDTARVMSPNGGMHVYFKYVEGTRNRGNLGAGVDLRSEGGYVCAAGSVMSDGRAYKWTVDTDGIPPIADAPEWLLDMVVRKVPEQTVTVVRHSGTTINSAYVNAAVDRELSELASQGMGNRNNALNDSAFALGQFVGAGALPESEARAMLQDVARGWGRDWARCAKTIENGLTAGIQQPREIPSIDQGDSNTSLLHIKKMIDKGLGKAKNKNERKVDARKHEILSDHHSDESAREALGSAIEAAKELDAPSADKPALVATPFGWKDPSKLPRREFTFGTHYIRKYVSVTVAPGGLGKTSNSIVEALAMVSGKDLTGTKPPGRLNVWLFNSEDPRDELERRIMGACLHYKLKPADVEGRLFLDTGREQELVIAIDDKKGVRIVEPIVEAIVKQIKDLKIDVLIVDPFVSTHSVNENDNGAIDKVAKLWSHIADRTNCAIDIVHHLRKVGDREATVEDSRGAVALLGAARSVRVLNQMSEEDATSAGLTKQDRFGYFSIYQGKSNLTKRAAAASWRRLESVGLGNGGPNPLKGERQDMAGVVTEWKWPGSEDIVGELTPDQIKLIKVRVDNGQYKEGHRAKNWVGLAIAYALGLDMEDEATRRRATSIYRAMSKEGHLIKSEEKDHVRREAAVYVRSDEFKLAA